MFFERKVGISREDRKAITITFLVLAIALATFAFVATDHVTTVTAGVFAFLALARSLSTAITLKRK